MKTTPTLHRDALTWLGYALTGMFAYNQAILGPILPFLRDELGMNFTIAGLHTSLLALGMALSGFTSDAMVRRIGRPATLWTGAVGGALGSLLIILGQSPFVTISGAFLIGAVGTWLISSTTAVLSDHHGELRSIPITESNVAASVFVFFGPLLVGGFQSIGLGWRMGILASILGFFVLALVGRVVRIPQALVSTHADAGRSLRLPRTFWPFWLLVVTLVSIEWSLLYWAAGFLDEVVGLPTEQASALTSSFVLAMIIGRVAMSRLLLRFSGQQLLGATFGVVAVGFALFWLGQTPAVNVLGLFLCGLGIAPQFPLGLALVTSLAPLQTDRVNARLSVGIGLSVFILPQALATLADAVGLFNAFGLLIVLWVFGLLLYLSLTRLATRLATA